MGLAAKPEWISMRPGGEVTGTLWGSIAAFWGCLQTDPSQTLSVCAMLGASVFQSKMSLKEWESLLNMHLK